jgi:hypothetical protein
MQFVRRFSYLALFSHDPGGIVNQSYGILYSTPAISFSDKKEFVVNRNEN